MSGAHVWVDSSFSVALSELVHSPGRMLLVFLPET
jgi:hypothetical protein